MDHGSLAYGHESPVQRRTCVPLDVAGDLLVLLLLIVVKIPMLPLCTGSLLPQCLRVMGSGLLPAIMPCMMYRGQSCLVKSGFASEGRTCWSGVFTMIPRVRVTCESSRGTPMRLLSFLLQIKNKKLHHIQTKISV
jgi:hypothetical protein